MYTDYNPNNHYQEPPRPPQKKSSTALRVIAIVLMVAVLGVLSLSIYNAVLSQPQSSPLPEPSAQTANSSNEQNNSNNNASNNGTSVINGYNLDVLPSEVAAKVIPSVVCIQNYQTASQGQGGFWGMEQSGELDVAAEGSGIIYTADGYIITNAHVVSGAELLKVVMSDGEVYEAKVIGVDEETDLALIKIEATGLTPADLGSAEELAVGDFVMAVGNPGGLEFGSSVTLGIVSAKNRPLEIEDGYTMNTIQTDAAINPGNSGGALVNMNGKVVGINSAKYVATGYEGLGFAITIDEALPIIEQLKENGKVTNRGMLGITGGILDSVMASRYGLVEGFYVHEVSNKDAGDLKSGDVITKIDDTEISTQADMKKAIQNKAAGTKVTVTYWRGGSEHTTTVTLVNAS